MKQKILVAEDESDIQELICLHLSRAGFEPEGIANGAESLERALSGEFSLLILDWMLPQVSGLEITKEVRKHLGFEKLGILMVTAKSADSDIILGLEAGADDYIVKPFELSVLMARVRALLRRTENRESHEAAIEVGGLRIDPASHEVTCHGTAVSLTPYEFKLLLTLVSHRGRVLTRDKLIAEVQGSGVAVVERAIDTHVFGLRKKLETCSEIIETVRGVGYRVSLKA